MLMRYLRDYFHYLKLRWQYTAAWKGKHALLYSGEWVEFSGSQDYERPTLHGQMWQDVRGRQYHSRDIRGIWGAEEFNF